MEHTMHKDNSSSLPALLDEVAARLERGAARLAQEEAHGARVFATSQNVKQTLVSVLIHETHKAAEETKPR